MPLRFYRAEGSSWVPGRLVVRGLKKKKAPPVALGEDGRVLRCWFCGALGGGASNALLPPQQPTRRVPGALPSPACSAGLLGPLGAFTKE